MLWTRRMKNFVATIKWEEEKDSLGSDSDMRSVDPASMSEDEEGNDANEKLVDEV
jgi:hypothetical protein